MHGSICRRALGVLFHVSVITEAYRIQIQPPSQVTILRFQHARLTSTRAHTSARTRCKHDRTSKMGALRICAGELEEDRSRARYTDVTVREAVEWTIGKDSEFSYVDVRSPEEHARPTTPRGCLSIPAFQPIGATNSLDDDEEKQEALDYEGLEWELLPDFVDKVKSQFSLDSKLLIGCKTSRSAIACQVLADAGFSEIYNVESQTFMKTRHPVWMDY